MTDGVTCTPTRLPLVIVDTVRRNHPLIRASSAASQLGSFHFHVLLTGQRARSAGDIRFGTRPPKPIVHMSFLWLRTAVLEHQVGTPLPTKRQPIWQFLAALRPTMVRRCPATLGRRNPTRCSASIRKAETSLCSGCRRSPCQIRRLKAVAQHPFD